MKSIRIIQICFLLLMCFILNATYHKIGHCGEPYWSLDMALKDNTLLIPDDAGIHIIDINTQANPAYFGCLEITDSCREIEISEDIAYVANSTEGLLILNVADPHSPYVIGSVDTPDCALALAVSDTIVYIADRHSGLQIIDVSNPNFPQIISSHITTNAHCIAASDTLVFIGNYMGNVHIFDVSDPFYPTLINTINSGAIEDVDAIFIDGSIAYFSTGPSGLEIYDIEDPMNISLITVYDVPYANEVSVCDNKLHLSCGYCGFQVLDVSDPANPVLEGELDSPRCVFTSLVIENKAYILDLYTGLEVFDIGDPFIPEYISSVDTPNYALSIQIENGFGYVPDNNNFLQIIDFNNVNQPYVANYFGVYGTIKDLIIVNNICYLITNSTLYSLQLNDPTHPIILSQIDFESYNYAVDYFNQHVYVATNTGVHVVNVSNPESLYKVSECYTGGKNYDVLALGHYVYLANNETGLTIVDVNDINNPVLLKYPGEKIKATALSKKNNMIYLSATNDGVYIIDIFDPINPIFIDCIPLGHDDSRYISVPLVHDNLLIFQDNVWNEIFFYNIFDPSNPHLINTLSWNVSTSDFYVFDDYLITTNNYHGVFVLDFEDITSSEEYNIIHPDFQLSNYPNPFNPSTTISFNLNTEITEDTEISIYNLKGQKVKKFCHAELACPVSLLRKGSGTPNSYSIVWDGTDDSNKHVSSGVYFYKLKVGNETKAVRKCLLLK